MIVRRRIETPNRDPVTAWIHFHSWILRAFFHHTRGMMVLGHLLIAGRPGESYHGALTDWVVQHEAEHKRQARARGWWLVGYARLYLELERQYSEHGLDRGPLEDDADAAANEAIFHTYIGTGVPG